MESTSWLREDKRNGFTLIEVLIAVSITAVVFTMLYGSFSQLVNSKRRIETRNELLQEANIILLKIRHDLANVFPRGKMNSKTPVSYPYSHFVGSGEGENSRLVFTSFARDPHHFSTNSGQSEISYYLVPLADVRQTLYALVRKDNYWIGNDAAGTAAVLSERVISFRVNFISEQFEGSETAQKIWQWNSSLRGGLPAAVQIEIVLAGYDENYEETHSMYIDIPVDK